MAGQLLYIKKEKKIKKDDKYYTPKYVVDFFFPDGFDYDPATCKYKADKNSIECIDLKKGISLC